MMRSLLLLLGAVASLGPLCVQAASCSKETGLQCEATDFTLTTCIYNVCDCKPGYVPIPSGCAKKLLGKPEVLISGERTGEVIPGSLVTLICSVTAPSLVHQSQVDEFLFYEWRRNGAVIGDEMFQTYRFYARDEAVVGEFSCKGKVDATQNSAADSEESDKLTVILLKNGSISQSQPRITNVPIKAANGTTFTPSCINIPIGATYKFEVGAIGLATPPLQFTAGTSIKCVLDPVYNVTFTNPNSTAVQTGVFVDDIVSVDLNIPDYIAVNNILVYNDYSSIFALDCITTPPKDQLRTIFLSYSFEDSMPGGYIYGSNRYYPAETVGAHTISCSASYLGKPAVRSPEITVTYSSDYVKRPLLTTSGTRLIPGSRLVLTCGEPQEMVTYTWSYAGGDAQLSLQWDRIIQFDNFTEDLAETYYCVAIRNNYESLRSNIVIVEISDIIVKPTIEKVDDNENFGERGDYELMCKTPSSTAGMTYQWLKNDTEVTDEAQGNLYKITEAASDKHDGSYKCTASFNGKISEASDEFEVNVTAAGRPCTAASGAADDVCSGQGYSGRCEDKRCECSDDYGKKGSVCTLSSQSPALMSSAILVLAAVIYSRLF